EALDPAVIGPQRDSALLQTLLAIDPRFLRQAEDPGDQRLVVGLAGIHIGHFRPRGPTSERGRVGGRPLPPKPTGAARSVRWNPIQGSKRLSFRSIRSDEICLREFFDLSKQPM